MARLQRADRRKQASLSIGGVGPDPTSGAEQDKLDEDEALRMKGLSKSIFFKLLLQHGVLLDEYEKALLTTVFGMHN